MRASLWSYGCQTTYLCSDFTLYINKEARNCWTWIKSATSDRSLPHKILSYTTNCCPQLRFYPGSAIKSLCNSTFTVNAMKKLSVHMKTLKSSREVCLPVYIQLLSVCLLMLWWSYLWFITNIYASCYLILAFYRWNMLWQSRSERFFEIIYEFFNQSI